MNLLFSERYEDLFHDESDWFGSDDDGDVSYQTKVRLSRVMLDFCEPVSVQLNRYVDCTDESNALDFAIDELNDHYDCRIVNLNMSYLGSGQDDVHALANTHLSHLFDLIELQYTELSDDPENGKDGFCREINGVFREQDVPWLLVGGRLVKVDAKQFELDLKLKAIERMQELRDANPLYQGAYDELRKAADFLGREDYAEAVINAGKSYESVLKVICGPGAETESANGLIKRLFGTDKLSLPESLKPEAFQNSVLLSLPIIRNKVAAHGSGATECEISAPMANLAVNLACALDTYLIQEATDIE